MSLQENWDNKIARMRNLKNLLLSLNPNLSSKLLQVKSFMLSQIVYIAPIIPISEQQIKSIEAIILSFLFPGRKTFSAARVFRDINDGGLGIPRPKAFIDSIRVKFAARALKSVQPWAILTKSFFPRNDITKIATLPLLEKPGSNAKRLAIALTNFHKNFYQHDPAKWSVPIFNSILNGPLTQTYITNPPPRFINTQLENISLSSLYHFQNKRVLTAHEIGVKFSVPINQNEYWRIYSIIRNNLPPHHDIPDNRPLPKSLSFFYSKNPAAKTFRRIYRDPSSKKFEDFQEVIITCSLSEGQLNLKKKIYLVNIWSLSFLPLDLKEFALLHLNNKHIFNLCCSRFNVNVSPDCNFCKLFPSIDRISGESYEHLYLLCPSVKPLADLYFTNLFTFTIRHRILLARGCQEDFMSSFVVNIELLLFNFYIFTQRSGGRIPTYTNLLHVILKYKKQLLFC